MELEVLGRNLPKAMHLGGSISLLRKGKRLSQRALAEICGVTAPTIIRLERDFVGRLSVLNRALHCLGAGPILTSRHESLPFYSHTALQSAQHTWTTPPDLLGKLYKVFGVFDLDPCSPTADPKLAPVKARMHFSEREDGLALPWFGTVFVNPPYGRALSKWICKARNEAKRNAGPVIALIPARTDTKWWHEYIAGEADILFLKGRLSFGDGSQPAPFPSALVVWGESHSQLEGMQSVFPDAWLS